MLRGTSDSEILAEWLQKLELQQYLAVFITQGFDISSVSKMTSEDLLAIGVSNPVHRKILHNDIQTWNVNDIWPSCLLPTEPISYVVCF